MKKRIEPLLLFALLLLGASCSRETEILVDERVPVTLHVDTRAGEPASMSDDRDRKVESLRVLVYDKSGRLRWNYGPGELYTNLDTDFENGVNDASTEAEFDILTGTYDFVFIANEGTLATPLDALAVGSLFGALESMKFPRTAYDEDKIIPMVTHFRGVKVLGEDRVEGADVDTDPGVWNVRMERTGIRLRIKLALRPADYAAWGDEIALEHIPDGAYLIPGIDNSTSTNIIKRYPRSEATVIPATSGLDTVVYERIILPELLFSPTNDENAALRLSVEVGGEEKSGIVSAPIDKGLGLTLPRNLFLQLTAEIEQNAIVFTDVRVIDWGDVDVALDDRGIVFPTSGIPAPPGVLGVNARTGELTLVGSVHYRGTQVANAAGGTASSEFGPLSPDSVWLAYFKWGSLIGLGSTPNDTSFGPEDIVWAAPEYDVHALITDPDLKFTDISAADNTAGFLTEKGLGDACAWADKGSAVDDYRMPTGNPFDRKSYTNTSLPWATVALPAPLTGTVGGRHDGWGTFLPAAGYRSDSNPTGTQQHTAGYYWTETQKSAGTSYGLTFNNGGSVVSNAALSGTTAAAIRCVADPVVKRLEVYQPTPFYIMGGSAVSPGREQYIAVESNIDWEVTTTDIPWLRIGVEGETMVPASPTTKIPSDRYRYLVLNTVNAPSETIGNANWYRKGKVTVTSKNVTPTITKTIDVEFLYGGYGDLLYFEGTGDDAKLALGRWGSTELNETNFKEKLAYFKFGSVIGSVIGSNAATSPWTFTDNVVFNPSNFDAGDITRFVDTFKTTYAEGTKGYNDDVWKYFYTYEYLLRNNRSPSLPGYDVEYSDDPQYIAKNTYHKLTNIKAGKGDPCRLVGLTVAQIRAFASDGALYAAEQGWRLPTAYENVYFAGGPGDVDDAEEPRKFLVDWDKWVLDDGMDVQLSGLYQIANDQPGDYDHPDGFDQSPYYDFWRDGSLLDYVELPVADGFSTAGSQKMPVAGQISAALSSNASINGAWEIVSSNVMTDKRHGNYDPLDPYDDVTNYLSSSLAWGESNAYTLELWGELRVSPGMQNVFINAYPIRCVR